MSTLTLYQHHGVWGLPSLSPADTQVQTYLQLAAVEHQVDHLGTAAQSPTEQLPALEHGAQLPGGEDGAEVPASEYEAARVLLRYLKDRVRDLDRDLPAAAQAEVLALTSLVQCQLEAASIYTTWLEGTSYSQYTKAAHGNSLPFPMNYWVPWRTRQTVAEHFRAHTAQQIYDGAREAYASLAKQMEKHNSSDSVKYFFGDQPSSVDAVLYPHLLYHHRSPVAAPELRKAVQEHPLLVKYIDSVAAATRTTVPRRPPRARSGWDRPAEATAARQETASERKLKQSGQMWLAAAGAAVAAYVILSGQLASSEYEFEDDDDDE